MLYSPTISIDLIKCLHLKLAVLYVLSVPRIEGLLFYPQIPPYTLTGQKQWQSQVKMLSKISLPVKISSYRD
jgi:hypothetical protein